MVFPWGALIGAAATFASNSGGSGLSRSAVKRRGLRALNQKIGPDLEQHFGSSLEHLQGSKKALEEGYDAALTETQRLGDVGARNILDRQKQQQGALEQGMTSRGLSGTTGRTAALRGLETDTQRQLSDNNARFAQMRANLMTGRGTAVSAAERDLSTHYKLRFDAKSKTIWDRYFGLWTGMGGGAPYVSPDYSGLVGPINSIAGWVGGQFTPSGGGGASTPAADETPQTWSGR